MWALLFLIKSTFLCLNPVLLLYSCGVMGMMQLNDIHLFSKTDLPFSAIEEKRFVVSVLSIVAVFY